MDRKIIISLIILLCIVAIIVGIVETINRKNTKENLIGTVTEEELNEEKSINDLTYAEIINKFNSIFDNSIDMQGMTILGYKKIDDSKDKIVYTATHYKGETKDKYNIDARIPNINIDNDIVKKINQEIDDFYKNRINTIINQNNNYINYTVSYKAYINSNVLSLIIKENLAYNDSAQKINIKTYNYDIKEKNILEIADLMNNKNLSISSVTEKINNTLEEANKQSDNLVELGAKGYHRDVNNEMYKIENTKNYFLGEDKNLYLIYLHEDFSDCDVVIIE